MRKEPLSGHISVRKLPRKYTGATKKPKAFETKQVGDMVQLDALYVKPLPGVQLRDSAGYDIHLQTEYLGCVSTSAVQHGSPFSGYLG